MEVEFAPLEGLTDRIYRSRHRRIFGGADRYYTPFLSPTGDGLLTEREKRQVTPFEPDLVPQLLTKRPEDFSGAAKALAELGYGEVDLNLGCPSGTVTAKGKGAALLGAPEELRKLPAEDRSAPLRNRRPREPGAPDRRSGRAACASGDAEARRTPSPCGKRTAERAGGNPPPDKSGTAPQQDPGVAAACAGTGTVSETDRGF